MFNNLTPDQRIQFVSEVDGISDSVRKLTLTTLRAIHGEYEEALNSLLIHVNHLETVERKHEQHLPFTTATIRSSNA